MNRNVVSIGVAGIGNLREGCCRQDAFRQQVGK